MLLYYFFYQFCPLSEGLYILYLNSLLQGESGSILRGIYGNTCTILLGIEGCTHALDQSRVQGGTLIFLKYICRRGPLF